MRKDTLAVLEQTNQQKVKHLSLPQHELEQNIMHFTKLSEQLRTRHAVKGPTVFFFFAALDDKMRQKHQCVQTVLSVRSTDLVKANSTSFCSNSLLWDFGTFPVPTVFSSIYIECQ